MAYDREKIYKQALSALKENKDIHFIDDLLCFLPISRPTFYDFFPVDSDKLNTIKEGIELNKLKAKIDIRKKLYNGDKAAELISLYKLIGTDDERRALSMQSIDHTTKGDKLPMPIWVGKSDE